MKEAPVQRHITMSRNANYDLDSNNFAYNESIQETAIEIFKPLDGIFEYQEKNYEFEYNNTHVKKFWYNLANHICQNKILDNFFSENFIHIFHQGHLSECFAVLSFFDLKFQKKQLKSTLENDTLSFAPETPIIALTKEIIEEEGK